MKNRPSSKFRLLKTKIYLYALSLFTLFIFLFAGIVIPRLNRQIIEERKNKLKAAVDIVVSLTRDYEGSYRENPSQNLERLKAECLGEIEKFRYEKNEYFFVMNGDGRILMHPLQPELLMWNMSYETDHRERPIFRDVLLGAMREGSVFIEALWQSKYNENIYEEQILYGEYFWPWDWVICSTLFTEDLKETNRKTAMLIVIYLLTASSLVFLLLFLFINSQVSLPLTGLLEGIYQIQKNNLDYSVEPRRNDEIGFITEQFNSMVNTRKKYEKQLIHSQKLEIVGTLASGVSHDFNNVIGSISAIGHLMEHTLSQCPGTAESKKTNREYLDTIQLCCDRASSIVNQLLTFSGDKSLNLGHADLNEVFRHIEALCRVSLDKTIEISAPVTDQLQLVNADQVQLEQTILNICINAGHAMTIMKPEGQIWGGRLALSKELVVPEQHGREIFWRIRIEDNGVGMSEETCKKIFDPFYSTKDKDKGTGLGLAMANKIIKDHGGWIDVDSEPGEGTVFSLYLPTLKKNPPQ